MTLITTLAAAQLLGISRQRAAVLARKQQIKAYRLGGSWVIDKESVLRYGETRKAGRPRKQ